MKLKSKWKALLRIAIMLLMFAMAGIVVFASEGDSGILTVDSYGPLHVTKIWLDNDNKEGKRPDSIQVKYNDVCIYHGTFNCGEGEITAAEGWTHTFTKENTIEYSRSPVDSKLYRRGVYKNYLYEVVPEGYEQVIIDPQWKICYQISDSPSMYTHFFNYNPIYYIGYDGERYMYLVNRLQGIEEPLNTYTVTYVDNVKDEVLFEDDVHAGIPSGAVTPAFTGIPVQPENRTGTNIYYSDPVRYGYTFMGWEELDGTKFSETVTKDTTYYAQWKDNSVQTFNVTYKITGDPKYGIPAGGTAPADPDSPYEINSSVKVLPAVTTSWTTSDGTESGQKGTWTFSGWDKGDFVITEDTEINGSWSFKADSGVYVPTIPVTPVNPLPPDDNLADTEDPESPEEPGVPEEPNKPDETINKPLPDDNYLADDSNVPKTGDTGADMILLNLLLMVAAAIAGTVLYSRKTDKKQKH